MRIRIHLPRAATTVALLAVLLPLPALAGYTEGMECYKQKDWDCVIANFATEVEAHPDYDFGWFMIGIAHLQKKDYVPAVENFNKAIAINGDKLGYHVNKAKAYTDRKQYSEVVSSLSGKESLEGTQHEVFSLNYQMGTAYHQIKKHGEAIPYLEKAAAVKPDFTTLYMLGVSYSVVGNTDKSISSLKEALKQKPGDAEVQFILGSIYLDLAAREKSKDKKGQYYTEAIRYAQGAVKVQPNDHVKQNLLARAYLGGGQFDKAETTFKRVLELDSGYCFAKVNLSKVYIATERWNDAVAILQQGTKCMPKSDVAWENLGFAQEKIYKSLSTDTAKIAQLNKALSSFETAAKYSNRSSIQASIDRVKQNIGIAQQNDAIANRNIRTMEDNLSALQRNKTETEAALKKLEDTRQFFLDKGNWPDDKEQDYIKEKADIERALVQFAEQIANQEKELDAAKAALNPSA